MLTMLLFVMHVAAGQEPRNATVKAELQALMTELTTALAAKDRAALERIYADEFLFVHALGAPVDKKAHIDSAMASSGGGSVPVPSFDGLLVYGDVAVLRSPVEGRFGTTIYAKKSGRWQIVQLQGTPLPSTRPSAPLPAEVLRRYAGRYQQDNNLAVDVTVESDQLMFQVQLEGRQKLALVAQNETTFIFPGGAGTIAFTVAADGTVSYEVKRNTGQLIRGTRVK